MDGSHETYADTGYWHFGVQRQLAFGPRSDSELSARCMSRLELTWSLGPMSFYYQFIFMGLVPVLSCGRQMPRSRVWKIKDKFRLQ